MRLRLIAIALLASLGGAAAQTGQTSPVSTAVTVGATSVQLLPANGGRHGITFYNQSANVISVQPGASAAVASGGGTINIPASGGSLTITCSNSFPCGNAFQGIASGAGSVVTIWEY